MSTPYALMAIGLLIAGGVFAVKRLRSQTALRVDGWWW